MRIGDGLRLENQSQRMEGDGENGCVNPKKFVGVQVCVRVLISTRSRPKKRGLDLLGQIVDQHFSRTALGTPSERVIQNNENPGSGKMAVGLNVQG